MHTQIHGQLPPDHHMTKILFSYIKRQSIEECMDMWDVCGHKIA